MQCAQKYSCVCTRFNADRTEGAGGAHDEPSFGEAQQDERRSAIRTALEMTLTTRFFCFFYFFSFCLMMSLIAFHHHSRRARHESGI